MTRLLERHGWLMVIGLLALAGIVCLSACGTTSAPITLAPAEVKPPLVITDARKEKCEPVPIELGADKLQLVVRANIEIEDCETKRAALQATIEKENAKRAANADAELARIKAKK